MTTSIDNTSKARDRSTSPVPPPPVKSTPGPRASALHNAYEKALEATMNKCSYDNFSSCFPTSASKVPSTLMHFHQDFVTRLQSACQSEFTDIVKDREVVLLLNSLDALIVDAKSRKEQSDSTSSPIAPHTLPPQDLVSAHIAPLLYQQAEALNSALNTISIRNADLMQVAEAQSIEISSCLTFLETMIQDIESSANLVQEPEMQSLTEDIKMISQELG